jgi:hypothetical protein
MPNQIVQMPTLCQCRQLLSKHKDQVFAEKYPQGQFVLHRTYSTTNPRWSIFWSWTRGNSPTIRKVGCGVASHTGYRGEYSPQPVQWDRPLGKRTDYKTLEKMLQAAEKFNFPVDLVTMFIQEYNTKHAEIERTRERFHPVEAK